MSGYPVIDHNEANPKFLVTPEIAGTPTPKVLIDGVGTASLIPYYILVTVNPGDDVTGATRLQNGFPDVLTLTPDNSLEITANVAITDLYLIAVGNTSAGPETAAPANYTGNYGIVANTEADAADWLAQQIHFTFSSADNVRRVRIACTPIFGTNYATVSVEGLSYA
jgi:hypothetical protein